MIFFVFKRWIKLFLVVLSFGVGGDCCGQGIKKPICENIKLEVVKNNKFRLRHKTDLNIETTIEGSIIEIKKDSIIFKDVNAAEIKRIKCGSIISLNCLNCNDTIWYEEKKIVDSIKVVDTARVGGKIKVKKGLFADFDFGGIAITGRNKSKTEIMGAEYLTGLYLNIKAGYKFESGRFLYFKTGITAWNSSFFSNNKTNKTFTCLPYGLGIGIPTNDKKISFIIENNLFASQKTYFDTRYDRKIWYDSKYYSYQLVVGFNYELADKTNYLIYLNAMYNHVWYEKGVRFSYVNVGVGCRYYLDELKKNR